MILKILLTIACLLLVIAAAAVLYVRKKQNEFKKKMQEFGNRSPQNFPPKDLNLEDIQKQFNSPSYKELEKMIANGDIDLKELEKSVKELEKYFSK